MISDNDILLLKQLRKTNPEIYSLFERIEQDRYTTNSNISHRVKNIISIISSSFQFIENQHPEASDYNLWPQLKSSITYLVAFMDQETLYRHSSNIVVKPMNLQDLLWSIPDIIDDIFSADTNNSIRNYNYDISINLPEINGDYLKLKYAFVEIVKNAYEVTSNNDTIYISAHVVDNAIAVSIKDYGTGIDNNIIQDVTIPFYTTKKDHAGTGLSIAKQVATAHGGNLHINTKDGTCITITLPL